MNDRMIISREPGNDIKVEAIAEAVINPEFSFTLTHLPTGIQEKGKGKQYNATVKKLRAKLLEKVEAHHRENEQRIRLTIGDLEPLRALHDKLHVILDKDRTQADYAPTLTELEDVVGLAGDVSERFGRVTFNLRHGRDRDEN